MSFLRSGCVLLCAAASCSPAPENASVQPPAADSVRALRLTHPLTVTDTLRFEALVPPTVREGDPVDFVLRLTNVTDQPIEVHLQGRETVFDLVVRGVDGEVVWRRLDGVNSLAILALRPLAAGDSLVFRHRWDQRALGQPVPAGRYILTGELPSDATEPLRTPAAAFTIEPR